MRLCLIAPPPPPLTIDNPPWLYVIIHTPCILISPFLPLSLPKVDRVEDPFVDISSCSNGWTERNSYCYKPVHSALSWLDAETACQDEGGIFSCFCSPSLHSFHNSFIYFFFCQSNGAQSLLSFGIYNKHSAIIPEFDILPGMEYCRRFIPKSVFFSLSLYLSFLG